MKEVNRLIKTTGIYFLGTVATKLISFLLLPLYTSYLLPDQYGQYDVNITYALLFSSACFLYIWLGIMKYMFESQNAIQQSRVVYCGLVIFGASSIIYLIAMTCFEWYMGIEYPAGVTAYGFFLCLQELYGYLARAYGKNMLFIYTGLAATACTAILNILTLVVLGWDYKALYFSYSVGILLQCVIIESNIRVIAHFRKKYLDKNTIKCLLRFSLPLCFESLCYWMLTGYNKIVIERSIDSASNGYYAVASKLGGILILISSCFSMAWQELAYRKYDKDKNTGLFYSYATNIYIRVLFGGLFIILPLVFLIFPYLVDSEYYAAKQLVPVNMMATLAGILFTFLGNIINTYKKTNILFISTFAACIVNITLLHTLIGKIGVEAASFALLAGYVVSDGIRIRIIGRQIDYHLDWKMFLYLLPFTGIVLLGYRCGQFADNLVLVFIGMIVSAWILWPVVEVLFQNVKTLLGKHK